MQLTSFRCLASLSLLVWSSILAEAAMRPRYGGTLHVEMGSSISAITPEALLSNEAESTMSQSLAALVFESLTQKDEKDQLRPGLAVTWKTDKEMRRWEFQLRSQVRLHDGSLLTPSDLDNALSKSLPDYSVNTDGDYLVVQCPQPIPDLPRQLARASYPIYVRSADGKVLGTGPFRIAEWNAGQKILLSAHEGYWGGRPYLDAAEIQMNRSPQDQLLDLELGKADLVQLDPDQVRRATLRGGHAWASTPLEVVALRFETRRPAVQDKRFRKAVALSIDRDAIHRVLLQKQGDPSAGLLPQWISGYAFLFPASRDLEQARQLVSALLPPARTISLAFDARDRMARMIAERISVNCRDAGIVVQVRAQPSSRAFNLQPDVDDMRLVRISIPSADPLEVLEYVLKHLAVPTPQSLDSSTIAEDQFRLENAVLQNYEVVPLFHLPVILGLSSRIKDWPGIGDNRVNILSLDNIWLDDLSASAGENIRELSN